MIVLDGEARVRALQRLANYPLLAAAESVSIESILEDATFYGVSTKEVLRTAGDLAGKVTFVLDGAVRIFHELDDGREYTPKILQAPNHFGDLQPLAGLPITVQSMEVLQDAVLAIVSWSALRQVLIADHHVTLAWLSGIASQFVYTIDSDRHNAFTGLSGRVANVILSYADVFGREDKGAIAIAAPLSRERLARHVGSLKRSVIRVLKTFEERGVIDGQAQGMVIKKPRELLKETLPKRVGLGHRMAGLRMFWE